jgi:hypothetical protein
MLSKLYHLGGVASTRPRPTLDAFEASAVTNDQPPPPYEPNSSPSSNGTLTPDSVDSQLANMADAASAITLGSLRQIAEQGVESLENPIVQCVQIKPMNSPNGIERYRVVMNDTQNFMQGMLAQRK